MNNKGNVFGYAIVFIVLFVIGGIIGTLSFPEFPGRFYISGMLVSIFGSGAGLLIIRKNG